MDTSRGDPLEESSLERLRREVEDLRESRARLIAAEHNLRRAVERELHDGAQQQLVAFTVRLQLASRLADTDPAALRLLLDEMRENVQEALDDVRRLAWRMYPSLLLDGGIAAALRAAASELAVPTHVEAPGIGRHATDVEAALYFCCLDLLEAAAARIDAGRRVTVRVQDTGQALRFDVHIPQPDPGRSDEQDLRSAGERLEALGGQLTVTSDERAVAIAGVIPLDR